MTGRIEAIEDALRIVDQAMRDVYPEGDFTAKRKILAVWDYLSWRRRREKSDARLIATGTISAVGGRYVD